MLHTKIDLETRAGLNRGMEPAIEAAVRGADLGQAPFDAAIFDQDGQLVVARHNRVRDLVDPIAHAEVAAIRSARQLSDQRHLQRMWFFGSCEPYPMCAATSVFPKIRNVVYGAFVSDAIDAGFTKLQIPCGQTFQTASQRVNLWAGIRRDECVELFTNQLRGVSC